MATPFLFGKLPSRGDFLSRGLGEGARGAWDEAGTRLIDTARERLGEGFEAVHQTAPPWRFVSGPSAFGPGWRAGALTPSVDAAGRRFVLVLGAGDLAEAEALKDGPALAAALEGALYAALASGLDADAAMDATRAALQPDPAAPRAPSPALGSNGGWWTVNSDGGVALHRPGAAPPADLLLLAAPAPAAEAAA